MDVILSPELAQFVDEQVKAGHYPSHEAVVTVALMRLKNELEDDLVFEPGELDALIAEGDAQLKRGETVPIEEVREYFRLKRVASQNPPKLATG